MEKPWVMRVLQDCSAPGGVAVWAETVGGGCIDGVVVAIALGCRLEIEAPAVVAEPAGITFANSFGVGWPKP